MAVPSTPAPPQVFLQNKARREDFCPRKLRQMHLMIDQLMAHSHLRYKGEHPSPLPPGLASGLDPCATPSQAKTPTVDHSSGWDWCLFPGTLSMLQCNIFPGLPPDFLDSEVNLFLVPFMDSEAESEHPPRAGSYSLGHLAMGRQPALGPGELAGLPLVLGPFLGSRSASERFRNSWSEAEL